MKRPNLSLDDIRAARRAPTTVARYRRTWARFVAYCRKRRVAFLPADERTIAEYLTHYRRSTTVRAVLIGICAAHTDAGFASPWHQPLVEQVFAGLVRLDPLPPRRSAALTLDLVQPLLRALPDTRRGARDRALFALAFAAALRVSELRALECRDVVWTREGIVLRLHYTKTGPHQRVAVPLAVDEPSCAVRALRRWLAMSAVHGAQRVFCELRGELPLRGRAMGLDRFQAVLAEAVERAHLPHARYTFHSFRAGLITTLARQGLPEHAIMRVSRHRTYGQLRGYIRDADMFRAHPLHGIY